MVKLKVVENSHNRGAQEKGFSKIKNGKVKKSKEFGSGVKSEAITNAIQNVEQPFKRNANKSGKRAERRKEQFLKRKFGDSLTNPASQQNVPKSLKRESIGRKSKKNKGKNKNVESEETPPVVPPLTRFSDDPIPKKVQWINRQRVVVFSCRGISSRDRHLMKDLQKLLPHSRRENKMERRENLTVVNEVCQMKHCNKCVLFEGRANRDVYMWVSNVSIGPSAKFLLQNIYTMDELKFTGNCLVGSRPLLSFDENFENILHYRMIKELLTQIFGVPNRHPKSQPFFDHVFTFTVLDNRIWFRNYQILAEDGALVEIGPRFIMNPVKIFEGSFGGETLWENPHYVTPAKRRQMVRKANSGKYVDKLHQKLGKEGKEGQESYKLSVYDEVFTSNMWESAKELVSKNKEIEKPLQQKKNKKGRISKGNQESSQS